MYNTKHFTISKYFKAQYDTSSYNTHPNDESRTVANDIILTFDWWWGMQMAH